MGALQACGTGRGGAVKASLRDRGIASRRWSTRGREIISLVGLIAVVMTATGGAMALADEVVPEVGGVPRPPVAFDGLGLDGFAGVGSIAAALQGIDAEEPPTDVPLAVVVKGPTGRERSNDPLAAELRGSFSRIDVVAGVQADATLVEEGLKKLVGGVRMVRPHEAGRNALELRTFLGQQQSGILGFEFGPRLERRTRGGMTVYVDGKAQAQATRTGATGDWQLPGRGEGAGTLGVAASTGLAR